MRTQPERPGRRPPPARGVALVLTVLLLAFIVLLLVGLSTLVQVESRVAENQIKVLQARRHALIGLARALGHLQQTAGPDRRATTRASFVADTRGNAHQWSGVWTPDDGPIWLVSSPPGVVPDPTSASFVDPVVLVGPATADIDGEPEGDPDQVRVEAVELRVPAGIRPGWTEAGDPRVGRFAYWIGDEAVKPSMVVRDQRSELFGVAASDPWPQMNSGPLWSGFDFHAPGVQTALHQVLAYSQIGYVDATAFTAARMRRNVHRVTVTAFGVLSNPDAGGLRQNGSTALQNPYLDAGRPLHDEMFLSSNPPAWDTLPARLPVARFAVGQPGGVSPSLAAITGPDAASHLLVAGAFNLNSVTPDPAAQRERWRAVLEAARVIHLSEEITRELTAGELDALASGFTADRLRMAYPDVGKPAGAPFRNVASFVGSGLVQAAIDATPINDGRTEESPDWIDQNHLLALLAPILFVRSDTFLIRAYGQVYNPILNTSEGEAWCEAVVQRLPQYVDPTDTPEGPPVATENLLFGRRMAVVSFRWMTVDDL